MATLFVSQLITAQSPPQKMSYQAVIRDANNVLIVSTTVGMKISILQASSMGGTIPVYVETQTPTSNINGLVSLEVGAGTVISGIFSAINWGNGPFYIKTETDPTGGSNYTITGTNQLLSVPYALYAGNMNVGGFKHYLGELFNGGIIYYLYKGSDGLEHGLIVALTELTTLWQNTPSFVSANRTDDGVYNTNLMTDSPAANYISGLGSGWYLPSIDELSLLYHNRFTVQKALRNGGHDLINSHLYWSSTELTPNDAHIFFFSSGSASTLGKINPQPVRGIKSF